MTHLGSVGDRWLVELRWFVSGDMRVGIVSGHVIHSVTVGDRYG